MELLIVGLDGLSFNMLDRFDVEFPYLDSVREEGVSGHLTSVDTPTTLPAWTSFATGKDPGSHGITDMVRQGADYVVHPTRTNTTDAAIYDFLDDSIWVNLPATFGRVPASEGSYLVTAMLSGDKYEAVPEELQRLSTFDDYLLNHDASLKVRPNRYLDHVLEITRNRHAFAREVFETYDPHVGFVLFSTPDWAGHILSNLGSDGTRREFYSRLLGEVATGTADLSELADNVVLMSDHGFEYKHTNIHLNDWFLERGYLRTARRDGPTLSPAALAVRAAKVVSRHSDTAYAVIRRAHNHLMGTSVGKSLESAARHDVDYARSDAWQLRYGTVYLNDDRFDSPTVDDPDALREELVDELRELRTPDGEPVFRAVLTGEAAYEDPGEWAPDVVARPAPGTFPTNLPSPKGGYTSPTENYEHRYRGIFAATGPLFASGETVDGMSIVDVLPTVLHALGRPISPDFDGAVRTGVLATDDDPAVMAEGDVPTPRTRRLDGQDSRDEIVEERLADLGYIE